MFGAKYQWILAGKYADDWWRAGRASVATATEADSGRDAAKSGDADDNERRCGEESLRAALDGYICADILILSSLQQPTVADMVYCRFAAQDFLINYESHFHHWSALN